MKYANTVFGDFSIAFGRLYFGGLVVLLCIMHSRSRYAGLLRRNRRHIFLLSVLNSIPFVVQPYVIREINNSHMMGILVSFVPIFTLLISIPMLKKRASRYEVIGTIGGLCVIIAILWDSHNLQMRLFPLLVGVSVPFIYAL